MQVPGTGLRAVPSLTLAADEAELGLLKEAASLPDAGLRGYELLGPDECRTVNAAIRGEFTGGLLGSRDAIVEPRQVLGVLRAHLASSPAGYTWLPGREAVELSPRAVRDHTGAWHRGDLVILCPGAAHSGIAGPHLAAWDRTPVRRVRLQMMQTEPFPARLTTSLADGDSLRYYPAYDLPGRGRLAPQAPVAARTKAQLLLVLRLDGGSPSATRTSTTSRSPSTWTGTPTITCAAGRRRCWARRCRVCAGAGRASTPCRGRAGQADRP